MSTLLIANNCTRESGSFMGDQLCALKTAYLFVESQPDVTKVIMSMSPGNEMNFLWDKFIEKHSVQMVWDNWHPGDWHSRWTGWDRWRAERAIEGLQFDHYRELYLRIHGCQRQHALCGEERGIGRRNIYQYWYCGQEHRPEELPPSVDWFDDTLVHHPPLTRERDVYVSPHCKTQGNFTFTFDYWAEVCRLLLEAGLTVTVGYDGLFAPELSGHPNLKRHWGTHQQWMEAVCRHRIVACGNTGTGWLAAACGVPMFTMEPHNSVMADHRYRECGLKNIVEVIDGYKLDELNNDMGRVAQYVAQRITETVRKRTVMTTGCYDILHAGHVRHLERARAMGTRLIVALNNDNSVRGLKGPDRPINPCSQRRAVLEALRCVDEVITFDGPNALHVIERVRPDVLVAGFGYDTDRIVGRSLVESWGGSVAVTCQGDARDEPSTTKILRTVRTGEVKEACREAAQYSVNPFEKLMLLAELLLKVRYLEGDVADLGTFRGGTALLMRRMCPEKCLHCFDTWEGNPYDDPLCHHKRGEWAASLEDCQTLLRATQGQLDTSFYKGVFPQFSEDGLAPYWLADQRFSLVYCDMDTYQATRDAIEFFWPRMVPGGLFVADDYGWEPCAGVKKAVDEVFNISKDYVVKVVPNLYTFTVEKR